MVRENQNRDPVEMLGEEFLARRRRGEDPSIEQYVAANRQFADQIWKLFPAMIAMEDLKVIKSLSSTRPIRLHVDRLERLGDYRIIREIGHGGMGIVYEAEQQSLRRRVAVKVFPKQAIGDTSHLKRFQREAETVGSLHHTNIVPVFGVGQQDGLHYFVMQLLEGAPLDELIRVLSSFQPDVRSDDFIEHAIQIHFADRQSSRRPNASAGTRGDDSGDVIDIDESDVVKEGWNAELKGRLGRDHWRRIADIGVQVAEALQYAHSNGVMHRDIKPSNLILASDSRVWVTDFGLAVTPQQERLSRSGDVVGTLRYMSPEQLHGRSDHRTDVYGLGLTLYELMTLRPAFQGESRGSLIRKVSQSTPPSPRSICPQIPKDLETVILKSIARSPESRYKSAAEFADDLRRFRDDQPIRARRIGAAERLCRWSRRNPAIAGMSLALMIGAIVSFSAVSWNWRQAIREKQNAVAQGVRAENNLTLALGSMDRLLEKFESDWMSHPVAPESSEGDSGEDSESQLRFVVSDQSATILEEALEFYDQFAQQNARSPKLQRETAKAYRRSGDILERLGRNDDAERAYRRCAEALLQQIAEAESESRVDSALVAETAAVLNRLAIVLHRVYRSEEAKEHLELSKQLLTGALKREEHSLQCTYELGLANSNLGLVLWRLHQEEESTSRHRRAILLLEGLAEGNPEEAKYRLALARAYRNYYPSAAVCTERVYACEIRESAVSILEKLVADFPSVPDYQCELSELLALTHGSNHVTPTQKQQQVDRAVMLADQLNRDFGAIPRYQIALARALTAQASLLRKSDPERSRGIHRRAADLLRQLCLRFPDVAAYRAFLANSLQEQGITLRDLHHLEEAICLLEEAVTQQAYYIDLRPDSVFARKVMAGHLRFLAESLELSGEIERAVEAMAHADKYWKRRPTEESDDMSEQTNGA